jgi:hypothetical protein
MQQLSAKTFSSQPDNAIVKRRRDLERTEMVCGGGGVLTPKERELLNGMANCYRVCHANFEDTVEMVGSARSLSPEEVKAILERLKHEGGDEYRAIRQRLPKEFPL